MRNLLDITDLTTQEINSLLSIAMDIIQSPEKYNTVCKGKKLATLFYEPSTRTRLSFTAAMMELGGTVLGFSDANASSVSKGETVADTVRVISCLADIIAMRHNKDGAPWVASQFASVPVINAGDGSHCHPTQTLADLLTVKRRKGGFDNLTVGFCGDLKYGRTVHSLTKALGRYKNIRFVFISPEELKIPNYLRQDIENKGFSYLETDSLDKHISSLDILYMTRIQKERFDDEEQYNRLKDSFILDVKKMYNGKSDMIVLHPLPRVNEITQEVDYDPRACYFEQVLNGKYIRMALIYSLLQWKDEPNPQTVDYEVVKGGTCNNSKCISSTEQVKPLFKLMPSGTKTCFYCDELV
jgi:aspartate carbamoyltransferase catalytic subunit